MLQVGIIVESSSPWMTLVVLWRRNLVRFVCVWTIGSKMRIRTTHLDGVQDYLAGCSVVPPSTCRVDSGSTQLNQTIKCPRLGMDMFEFTDGYPLLPLPGDDVLVLQIPCNNISLTCRRLSIAFTWWVSPYTTSSTAWKCQKFCI